MKKTTSSSSSSSVNNFGGDSSNLETFYFLEIETSLGLLLSVERKDSSSVCVSGELSL